MLQKSTSRQVKFKHAFLIPIVVGMLVYTSSEAQTNRSLLPKFPFPVVEQVPVFPGCEDFVSNEEKKQCTSNKIAAFFTKNFNTELANNLGLTGRQSIPTQLKIDIEGNTTVVRSKATHPDLEAEVVRVTRLLPKMIPGEEKGRKVDVLYSLPFVFVVAD